MAMQSIVHPIKTVVALAQQYERHLSAASLAGGYAFDSYTFGRIDHASTHIVFIAYLTIAATAIAVSHHWDSGPEDKRPSQRTRTILTAATQFALGCLLSGFCVFYLRSASLWTSWPYLILLVGIFIGNEFFKAYTTRLTLSLLLFFFALFSYAILFVPVLIAVIGTTAFLISGIVALAIFWFYADVLAWLGRERFRQVRLHVLVGTLAIYAVMNLFYLVKILPPLPLALADAGIYHSVKKNGDVYQAVAEPQPWTTIIGAVPVLHVTPGEKLYFYSSVFAPARVTTVIVHRWEWLDPTRRQWVQQSRLSFAINGGRDAGYRGYSIKSKPKPGAWRVNILTNDGRPLGRIRFAVELGPPPQPLVPVTLN